jgi:HK97 family phage major capsid protein
MQQYSNAGDMVQVVDAIGNQRYTESFEKDIDEADYTDDGQTYTSAGTNFGNVVIDAGKITTKVTVKEGLMKLTSIPFAQKTLSNASKSLKKKVAKAMVLGDGSSIDGAGGILKKFVGIYNATGDVAPVIIEKDSLDIDSLVEMMLAYGNDETTGGFGQVLMLNKKDLEVLIKLKDASQRYFFKWQPDPALNGNGGQLTVGEIGKTQANEITVNYIINSACKPMATAVAGDKTIIYGNLYDYLMPIFGDMELRTKREDNGDYSVFASIFAGGNISGYKKFVVMQKPIV